MCNISLKNLLKGTVSLAVSTALLFGTPMCAAIIGDQVRGVDVKTGRQIESFESYYSICDVVAWHQTDDLCQLFVEISDGSIQEYRIEDAPEDEVTEVCFYVPSENYETWEVVAVR